MKLVVVESPAKAGTIQKYLGKGYTVKASKGHIVDLPKSGLAIDVDHDYEPTYIVTKSDSLKALKQAFKQADGLILAVDPDREGEAIGWHVARELGLIDKSGRKKSDKKTIERISFTEITKDAVQTALENPRSVDMDLVKAQQARRILDRLVGYKLSPLIWTKVRYGLSAGRVQSVAVRLIVEREKERDKFKADEYWTVDAALVTKKGKKVAINLLYKDAEAEESENEDEGFGLGFNLISIGDKKPQITKDEEVKKITADLENEGWVVIDIKNDQAKRNPFPPFSTSTLQQTAVNRYGFSSSRTMKAAQKLYEAGHITYMRTDSIGMSNEAIAKARDYITSKFGADYIPAKPNFYATKSKVAQEAHEAIRPSNFAATAESLKLDGDESRLYTLIRNRALASQMLPAVFDVQTVKVKAGKYTFQAQGRKVAFKGFLAVSGDDVSEFELPKLELNQEMFPETINAKQHFTQPPARFSEATLIKELERLGIGRPSTYAPIIMTIQQRKYVEKEGRYFKPTDTGIVVTELLTKHFSEIVDTGFTAHMEDELDDVAEGKLDWVKMLDEFYKPFAKKLVTENKKIDKDEITKLGDSDKLCPICGKPMIIKLGRYGRFLSCSDYPKCEGILSIDGESEEDIQNQTTTEEFKQNYLPAPKTESGQDFILKKGRFGLFWAHPDYPKVKDARPLEMTPEKKLETYGEPPKTEDGRDYLVKKGRFGFFWAHPDYPKVKDIQKVKRPK